MSDFVLKHFGRSYRFDSRRRISKQKGVVATIKNVFFICVYFVVSSIVGRCSSKHNVWRWCIMLACVYFVFIQILLSQNILDFFKCKHGCVSECAYVRRETETRVGYRGEARILICIRRFLFIQIFTKIISIIRTALIILVYDQSTQLKLSIK